jgi:antitoxin component YwqK of YwqJK toxin-antitoxin module
MWYYPDGTKRYEVTRDNGAKVGLEMYFTPDGRKEWQRQYTPDGKMTWTAYWPDGGKKSESLWVGPWAQGVTTNWDKAGRVTLRLNFKDGRDVAFEGVDLGDD